jgi:hypothetical protein
MNPRPIFSNRSENNPPIFFETNFLEHKVKNRIVESLKRNLLIPSFGKLVSLKVYYNLVKRSTQSDQKDKFSSSMKKFGLKENFKFF